MKVYPIYICWSAWTRKKSSAQNPYLLLLLKKKKRKLNSHLWLTFKKYIDFTYKVNSCSTQNTFKFGKDFTLLGQIQTLGSIKL